MDNKYQINYDSTEVQPMSEEKASGYKLWQTANEYLGGSTMFFSFSEQSKYTYEDFVSYIGCDATNYYFDEKNKARAYTWIANDDETKQFLALFTDKTEDGKWTLKFTGSTNLMTKPELPDGETAYDNIPKSTENINVDEILSELKDGIKKEFAGAEVGASTLAGTLIALMGAGLFAAGLSTMGNPEVQKNDKTDTDGAAYELQKLSDEKVSSEILKKTHSEWLDGKYTFVGTAYELLTYENVKEHIGCEATVYYYDKIQNTDVYTWLASDDSAYSLCIWFKKKGENKNLYLIPPQ